MDVKYLNYILTIAKKKNMTKAAEELYVSQSSLSQYLTKLEQELGTQLFFRAKGELTLTPAGHLYIKAAEQVIHIQKQLYKNIFSLENKGHITVGVTSQWGLRMLSEIIPKYKLQYPDVTIEISETSLPAIKKMLVEENIDIGIMSSTTITPFENQTDILRNEEVLLALPIDHPYRKTNPDKPIAVSDLSSIFENYNFILSKAGSSLRFLSDKVFEEYDFSPSAVCETNSIFATRNMISQGVGIGFIASSCSHDEDKIAYYSLEPKLFRQNIMVRRQHWVMTDLEQVFCSYIKNYFILQKENPYKA